MINPGDYTAERRLILKGRRSCALYAIGPVAGIPCKIGIAENVGERLIALQVSTWIELQLHYVLWTPGRAVARTVERACHNLLREAQKWRIGEWFDIPPEWAGKAIETMATKYYPSVQFLRHADMLDHCDAIITRRVARDKASYERDCAEDETRSPLA